MAVVLGAIKATQRRLALPSSSTKLYGMHRILLPIIVCASLLALTSCKEKPADDLARNCLVERSTVKDFSLCLPDGWAAVTQEFGEEGSYIVMLSDNGDKGLVMQVHVKKDTLEEPVKQHLEFSERAVEIARDTAPNYKPVSTEPITVNGKQTILHIFEASPDEAVESIRYYQFIIVNNGAAYGFTGVMMPEANEDLQKTLIDVFTNVRFG